MISGAFPVALLWMRTRIKCPIIQVRLPKVHNKTTEINGLTLQQPFFEHVGLSHTIMLRAFIADRMWDDRQSLHCGLSCILA